MSRVASLRRVAGINRIGWPVWAGIGGRLRPDWVAEITRIRTKLTDCLNLAATALFSAEIRRQNTMQNLIIKEFGCRLSFFTIRDSVSIRRRRFVKRFS